jgi:hypothetical protein
MPWWESCAIFHIGRWQRSTPDHAFFQALAFTVLENAMSVIFFHRVKIKRRNFLVSAVMPLRVHRALGLACS